MPGDGEKVDITLTENVDANIETDNYATIDSVMPKYGFKWFKVKHLVVLNFLLLICMLSSTNNGYDGSLLNGLQSVDIWQDSFNHPKGQHLGGIANGMMFGGIACYPIVPWVLDKWGRKYPIAFGAFGIIVGAVIQAVAPNYTAFVAGRLVLGFGSGFCTSASPLLLAETAYPEHRHVVTAVYNTLWPFGSVLASFITLGCSYINSTWSWRIPCLLQGLLPLVQLSMVYWVPESPRFLIDKHRFVEARKILVKYHAGGDETSRLVDFEMAEISVALEMEKIANETSYMDFLRTKGNRYRLFLLCIIPCNMQLSGNGLTSYYLNIVLNSIGITNTQHQLYLNCGMGIFSFVVYISWAFVVERFGRRKMFLSSLSGMLVVFTIWTILSALGEKEDPPFSTAGYGNGVLAMIFMFWFFYGIDFGMPILYFTEILPYQLRAKGMNITNMVTTLALIYNGFVNPVAMDAIGWKYYIVWICLIALWLVIAYFFYPETRGHTLETVGVVFGEEVARVNDELGANIGRESEKSV